MKRAGSLLKPFVKELGIEEGVKLEEIRRRWNTLFRKPLSSHLFPALLSRGELLIAVDSSVWLQEVKFFTGEVVKRLGPFGVKSVRFKIGSPSKHTGRHAPQKKPRALTAEEVSFVESTVSAMQDERLRDTIRNAVSRSIQAGRTKT
ncbi:MAG: DUF721 domain-containing protein [Nitrospirota bacterium]